MWIKHTHCSISVMVVGGGGSSRTRESICVGRRHLTSECSAILSLKCLLLQIVFLIKHYQRSLNSILPEKLDSVISWFFSECVLIQFIRFNIYGLFHSFHIDYRCKHMYTERNHPPKYLVFISMVIFPQLWCFNVSFFSGLIPELIDNVTFT